MSSSNTPCAACKYLRRKCTEDCVFAPYFPPENPQKFVTVHKVFGASNVGKILKELMPNERKEAVTSLAYEADCRMKDPIYGCVGFVYILQRQLHRIQQETERAKKELASFVGPAAMQAILNNPAAIVQQQRYNSDPYAHQTGPYQGQQLAAMSEQEILLGYAQQKQQQQWQQLQQLYENQLQELDAHQQQMMQHEFYLQQQQLQQNHELGRFNDAGDPKFDGGGGFVQFPGEEVQQGLGLGGGDEGLTYNYQVQQQKQHAQQVQIHPELLMQQQPHNIQLMEHDFASKRPFLHFGNDQERSRDSRVVNY